MANLARMDSVKLVLQSCETASVFSAAACKRLSSGEVVEVMEMEWMGEDDLRLERGRHGRGEVGRECVVDEASEALEPKIESLRRRDGSALAYTSSAYSVSPLRLEFGL